MEELAAILHVRVAPSITTQPTHLHALSTGIIFTPLLSKIFRAWTSGTLWTVTTTYMATLACVPNKAFLL